MNFYNTIRYDELIQCVMDSGNEKEISERIEMWYEDNLHRYDSEELDEKMLSELEMVCLEYNSENTKL